MTRLVDVAEDFVAHSFVSVLNGDQDGSGHDLSVECRRLLARGDCVLLKNFEDPNGIPFTLDFLSKRGALDVKHQLYDIHGMRFLIHHKFR